MNQAASRVLVLGVLVLCVAGTACGFGSDPLEVVDPDVVPAQPDFVTHVEPILALYCTQCHSQQALPWSQVTPYLDDQRSSEASACQTWQTINDGSMPPGALDRLTSRERLTMLRWAGHRGCRVQ